MDVAELHRLYSILNVISQAIGFSLTFITAVIAWRAEFAVISVAAGLGLLSLRYPPPEAYSKLIPLISIFVYLWFFTRISRLLNSRD